MPDNLPQDEREAMLRDAQVRLDDRAQRLDTLERQNAELHVCLRAAYAEADRLKAELASPSQTPTEDALREALEAVEDLRGALEAAEDFAERVKVWTGDHPDEVHEVLRIISTALSAAGPSERP